MIRDEQQRILQYLDDRLQHMLAAPELWGSAEAVELQVVQILELRHFVLNPTTKAGEREVLARYARFLAALFPSNPPETLSALLAAHCRHDEFERRLGDFVRTERETQDSPSSREIAQ